MVKKVLMVSALVMTLALPAFAETTSTGTNMPKPNMDIAPVMNTTAVACVGSAVATRESALGAGFGAYSSVVSGAYGARATALAQAYTATSTTAVRAGIKAAWTAFNTSVRTARKTWTTTREGAWTAFRTAAKACKAPSSVNDSANASSEVAGN